MTALTAPATRAPFVWTYRTLTMASGQAPIVGAAVAIALGTGKIVVATGAANQLYIGTLHAVPYGTPATLTADTGVSVSFEREINGNLWANDSAAPVAATDLGKVCYFLDDNTVTAKPTGTVAGRVWLVEGGKVYVQPLESVGSELRTAPTGTLTYTSNDCVLTAARCANGTVYDVPTTGAASTITLPVTNVPDGTTLTFVADGTKNGHTVQYRFGTTNITATLTASKIHRVQVTKLGTGWGATSTVAP